MKLKASVFSLFTRILTELSHKKTHLKNLAHLVFPFLDTEIIFSMPCLCKAMWDYGNSQGFGVRVEFESWPHPVSTELAVT